MTNFEKLSDAVKSLSDADERFDDIFEVLGIVVDDIADMYKATDAKQFIKQKSDARRTLKIFKRKIDNLTFKQLKAKKV